MRITANHYAKASEAVRNCNADQQVVIMKGGYYVVSKADAVKLEMEGAVLATVHYSAYVGRPVSVPVDQLRDTPIQVEYVNVDDYSSCVVYV